MDDGGVAIDAAFAAFSRRICSLLKRISDFGGSLVGAVELKFLGSVTVALEAIFASSTSPSSTSAVAGCLGVETLEELRNS